MSKDPKAETPSSPQAKTPDSPQAKKPAVTPQGSSAPAERRADGLPVGRPFTASGNPRGRPRKRPVDPINMMLAPFMKRMIVTENGKSRRIPRLEAFGEMRTREILNGDTQAAREYALMLRTLHRVINRRGGPATSARTSAFDTGAMRRILDDFEAQIVAKHKKSGGGDDKK